MGLAAIRLPENPNAKKRAMFRKTVHEEADKWVDELRDQLDEQEEPTLEDMGELLDKVRQKFMGKVFEMLVEQKYAEKLGEEYAHCPKYGRRTKRRRKNGKHVSTMQGKFDLECPWFYCSTCSHGFCPVGSVLEMSRKEHQFDIQEQVVKIAARVPFGEGSEIFKELTGRSISPHFLYDTFTSVGEQALLTDVIPTAQEIAQRIKEASHNHWRPILVIASDEALLPTRAEAKRNEKRGPGFWKGAKGFRVYLATKGRIIHIASWHQIQNEEQFGHDLAEVAALIPQDQVRIALLGDDADWLWNHMTRLFPKGRLVLDYYHCAQHVYKVAKFQYGEESTEGFQWVEATLCRLFFAEVDDVLDDLSDMDPASTDAKAEIGKLIGYLAKNYDRIHWRGDRIGGYPIGSGGIESANKFICHTRMKRSGAWWVQTTGNHMLRIRCAIYNGTYDRVFEKYKKSGMSKTLFSSHYLTNWECSQKACQNQNASIGPGMMGFRHD